MLKPPMFDMLKALLTTNLGFWILALMLSLSSCSAPPTLPGVYSDPRSGRLLDLGPQGMMAEQQERLVTVGTWKLDGDDLSTTNLSHPRRGEEALRALSYTDSGLRLDTEGSQEYETFQREPTSTVGANEALTGLWFRMADGVPEFTEYTPWGTLMWTRVNEYEGQKYVVGGWARYTNPYPGKLHIRGGEFNYSLLEDDKYQFSFEGENLILESLKTHNVREYQRVESTKLHQNSISPTPLATPTPSPTGGS